MDQQDPPGGAATLPSADATDGETLRLRRLVAETTAREAEARRAVALLNSVIDMLPVAVTVQSEHGETILANAMAATFAGAGAGAPDATRGHVADGEMPIVTEELVTGPPHDERTLLVAQRPVRILDRSLLVSAAFDFTARKQEEIELSRRAYFDELTGLPNGILVQDYVRKLLARDDGRRFALAFLDIDNFKHVNDYYTHAVGDALLSKVTQRITAQIRPSDFLGRISGDEFILVIDPLENGDYLEKTIESLLKEIKEPFLIEGYEVLTSASVGLSIYPDHGMNYETLRRAADTAMYRVKEANKGAAALFDTDMGRAMTARMAQEQRLRLAVRDSRFCCAFQPKVDIRSQEVVGVEALIRLRDEDGVIQGPGDFIDLAVELGLINDITYLALAEIMRSSGLLDDAFGSHTTISINIAAKQASDPKFMAEFCDELRATGRAERFMVEVTEDAFLAKGHFQTKFLPLLREMGTQVSVDDFGTGYSSLGTLADVTADEIKIDRSFITGIHERPRSQSVLKAIEALGEALGMTVIAEGVETFEELAYLQAATRIRFAQGYYFAKPIFLEELTPARRMVGARSAPRSRFSLRA